MSRTQRTRNFRTQGGRPNRQLPVGCGIRGYRVLLVLLALPNFALAAEESAEHTDGAIEHAVGIPPGSGVVEEVLGCKLPDGSGHLAAPTPEDMPWRVSIGMPKTPPRLGSIKDGREAAIESMRGWERALQTELPWFKLEFVMKDRGAPVQIKWKRRTTGTAQARAGPTCMVEGDRILAGGRMEIAVRACPTCSLLELSDVALLMAHEFGHILGLGHCLSCDSAMNYSFQTEKRIAVTQVDVDAVVRRFDSAKQFAEALRGTPDPDDYVELAADTTPLPYKNLTCKNPFTLKRSCSNKKGPTKGKTLDGLEVRLAASKDGSIILMTPDSLESLIGQAATAAANERFSVVTEVAEEKGVTALRATALTYGKTIVGYLIEFDGDAWSALDL